MLAIWALIKLIELMRAMSNEQKLIALSAWATRLVSWKIIKYFVPYGQQKKENRCHAIDLLNSFNYQESENNEKGQCLL